MSQIPTTSALSHRLLVSPERWDRLRQLPDIPLVRQMAAQLDALVEPWLTDRAIPLDETAHNWHLIRARHLQTRVVSLLVQYGRTGERRYRAAALDYIRDMGAWEYWSWIAWRGGHDDPNATFDLSYGENAATLALAYDWLAAELADDERALCLDIAQRRALTPYLERNGTPGEELWYYRAPNCNWNTVCNGGAGMLALALGDALPECARVLALAEEGIRHYFEFLQDDGAWPEGIGYWGYGHRYGYYYLLSHERATGQRHPLLERAGSRSTLRFPFLFSPNGVPASFGDVNHFFPLPFVLAAAERYAMWDVAAEMERRLLRLAAAGDEQVRITANHWPNTAELLLFHPGDALPDQVETPWPRASVQAGLEWGYLADRWPHPRVYVSVRGGTTDAPHTHQDLLSLFVIVGEESLIMNVGADNYLDTTFSPRRFELYEHGAAAKNTLFVNGVALPQPATVATQRIAGQGWEGILLDGAAAMVAGTPVQTYGRAVLLLQESAILVLDRITLQHVGLGEVRFHTFAEVQFLECAARITGQAESLHLAFAASVPARLRQGMGIPTLAARDPDTMLRWMTEEKHHDMVFATLLTPNGTGELRLDTDARTLHATGPGVDLTFGYPAQGLGVLDV